MTMVIRVGESKETVDCVNYDMVRMVVITEMTTNSSMEEK